MNEILQEIGLEDIFRFLPLKEDCEIEEYTQKEYIDGYQLLLMLAEKVNCKIDLQFENRGIDLRLMPIVDYSEEEHWDSSHLQCSVEKVYHKVNHLIVYNADAEKKLDIYLDANGEIGKEAIFTGIEEQVAVLTSSSTIEEDMQKEGEEELKKLQDKDSITAKIAGTDSTCYDILDRVGLVEHRTGIEIKQKITKKIVTITDEEVKVEYQTGGVEE